MLCGAVQGTIWWCIRGIWWDGPAQRLAAKIGEVTLEDQKMMSRQVEKYTPGWGSRQVRMAEASEHGD